MYNDQNKFNILYWNTILNIFNTLEHSTISFVTFLFSEQAY